MFQITDREKEVLRLISQEFTAREIADKLYISTHTVRSHRKNLLEKLQVRNTAGMVRRGFESGLLTLSGRSPRLYSETLSFKHI